MLSSQGPGKYVFGKWERERAQAMKRGGVHGDYSQDQLELSDEQVGGALSNTPFETFTDPVDPFSNPKRRDIRDSKEKKG